MERPRLLRERSPAGTLLSVRWGRLRFDYMRKAGDFTLWQIGRGRMRFLCRIAPENKRLPLFLFNAVCTIHWANARTYIGTTSNPISLDQYWRAKGWTAATNRAPTGSKKIGNGSV